MSEERDIQGAAVRQMIDAVEAVAGVKGRNMVLRRANLEQYIDDPPSRDDDCFVPAAHYRAICRGLRESFGDRGSRPVLIYAGEETIYQGVKGGIAGAFGLAMRLMPGGLRRKAAFKVATVAIERITGIPPKVQFEKDRVIFHYYNCPYCEGSQSDEPICFYDVGILKALAEWGMGKPQKVTEIECAAMGAEACVYEIKDA
jgi:divinyl protochlorophyllide a 8-vinyl-reductase